jgi:outer membrane receptor protein involved in Fe transport
MERIADFTPHRGDRLAGAVRLVLIGASGLALTAPVLAADQATGLSEVVVTASRTGSENLQDIPMSISALDPGDLSARGLSGMSDFLRAVPGVVLNAETAGVNRVTMRGLVSRDINITDLQDRSMVAIYLDEIPIGLNMSNPDLRVLDMERIEVIRGPQGTLYGAGSMAGTVRYITRKPDLSSFFGTADSFVSSTEDGGTNWGLKGSVNLPLADGKAALRLGAYRQEDDGFVDRADASGTTVEEDANSQVTTQANAALRWTPTEALTADLSFTYQEFESDGSNGIFRELDDRAFSGVPTGFDDDLQIFNLTLNYDAGPVDIISSTSYVDREFTISSSFDFISLYLFGVQIAPSFENSDIQNFTQEIRVVSKPGPLQWQLGAYYANDERHYVQNSFIEGLDALIGIPSQDLFAPYPDQVYYGNIPLEDEQWALFGEATYQVSDRWSLTAGLRYFDFEGSADYFQGGIAGVDADLQPVAQAATEEADGFNPKFLASFQLNDDVMFFVEAARGFRYGGVNYPVPISFCGEDLAQDGLASAPLTFGPDEAWSYSIGEKGAFLDRRMTLNATAFYIQWTDAQTVHPLDCGYPFTENGGDIDSLGFEFETYFQMTEALTVGLNATYTDAQSDGGIPTIGAQDGDSVPYFPEWMAAVTADYVWTVGTGELRLAADYSYRDDMGTEFNPADLNYRTIPSGSVVNASLNYRMGSWEVGVFGTNLGDDEQISYVGAPTLPSQPGDQLFLGRPRTFGLRVQVDF